MLTSRLRSTSSPIAPTFTSNDDAESYGGGGGGGGGSSISIGSNNNNNNNGGGGTTTTLSKDALYAPLSTYTKNNYDDNDDSVTNATNTDDIPSSSSSSTKKKKKRPSRHSLTMQQNKSSSLPSLLTTLSSISAQLKTSHAQTYQLYRGLGGVVSRYGMGDNDRITASASASGASGGDSTNGGSSSSSMRAVLEGKLLNRSLILVGGGVHGKVSGGGGGVGKDSGVESLGETAAAAAVSSSNNSNNNKRERKRVGGNGIFGCISNKKRKRILRQALEKKKQLKRLKIDGGRELKMHDGDNAVHDQDDVTMQKEEECGNTKEQQIDNNDGNKKSIDTNTIIIHPATATILKNDEEKNIGIVITTMHKMWIGYMHQLLSPIKQSNAAAPTTAATTATNTMALPSMLLPNLANRKRIATILATSEHVGMPATIVECPSRRHLLCVRCVVIDETKETWKVVVATVVKIATAKINNARKENETKTKDGDNEVSKCVKTRCDDVGNVGKKVDKSLTTTGRKQQQQTPPPAPGNDGHHRRWKMIVIPKRGTVLEVDVPWWDDDDDYDSMTMGKEGGGCVTVRLET